MIVLPLLAALAVSGCPHDASLGTVTFQRGAAWHAVSLGDCRERPAARPRSTTLPLRRNGHVASVRVTRTGPKTTVQTITLDGRPVYRVHEDYRKVPGGDPGPIALLDLSPDARWIFFSIDPESSSSIAADGVVLKALRVSDGRVSSIGVLLRSDYLTWCGSSLVLTLGGDRIATTNKRLVVAHAPDWKPRLLWRDESRAFGTVRCAPDGKSVAVLSQRASTNANFFATRWQLWRVGLDGSRRLIDQPPKGFADESPRWSRDGRSLLFARERNGYGRLMLWRAGEVVGPLANLGYSLGYYGHHDWPYVWSIGYRS